MTIGWANQYSPILDVTSKVLEVDPIVQKAELTIWGDPAHVGSHCEKLKIIGPLDRRIELKTMAIVRDWMQGMEWENEKCESDGHNYFVMYPCKLKIIKPGSSTSKWLIIGLAVGAAGLAYYSYKNPELIQIGKSKLSNAVGNTKTVLGNRVRKVRILNSGKRTNEGENNVTGEIKRL